MNETFSLIIYIVTFSIVGTSFQFLCIYFLKNLGMMFIIYLKIINKNLHDSREMKVNSYGNNIVKFERKTEIKMQTCIVHCFNAINSFLNINKI